MTKNQNKLRCKKEDKSKDSNEGIQLSLEVEIDDEVKDIINSPRKCASTLLDVTVIKPQDVEKLYTIQRKTLRGNDVKNFIASMKLNKKDMRKVVDHILSMEDRCVKQHPKPDYLRSSGDYRKGIDTTEVKKNTIIFEKIQKLHSTDEHKSDQVSNNKKSNKIKQIYTTPKTFHDLNSLFECKNKKTGENNNEKLNMPCPCQNCAIVGVVTDTQKRPFATDPLYDPTEMLFDTRKDYKHECKKKKVNFKEEDHLQCHQYYKHLSNKIKELEARLSAQEERSVPKDYFKRIIGKLVNHITKLTSYGSQHKIPNQSRRQKEYSTSFDERSYDNFKQKYHVHQVLVPEKEPKMPNENQLSPTHKNTSPSTSTATNLHFWKWGEEILRPGIDLKNKIVVLVEEKLKNMKWSSDGHGNGVDIKGIVDGISTNLYKTVHDIPEREDAAYRGRDVHRKKTFKEDNSVKISYVNPSEWNDSQASLIFDTSDLNLIKRAEHKRIQDYYKSEFMKIISSTKEEDKIKLWQSIWHQAKANGQSKKDKVTIQLPDQKDPKCYKIVEIEYTIGELETLLIGKRR